MTTQRQNEQLAESPAPVSSGLVISIQQPWAYAILKLGKDIENRTWPTKVRGRVLIHAGKKRDTGGEYWLNQQGIYIPFGEASYTGGIVGSVEIVDCVQKSDSKWFFGQYGFVLRNPQLLPFQPCRGQLGFFRI